MKNILMSLITALCLFAVSCDAQALRLRRRSLTASMAKKLIAKGDEGNVNMYEFRDGILEATANIKPIEELSSLDGFPASDSVDKVGRAPEVLKDAPQRHLAANKKKKKKKDNKKKDPSKDSHVGGSHTFWNPLFDPHGCGSVRLDWFYFFAKHCGRPAADDFCRTNGYARASSFDKTPIRSGSTRTLGGREFCRPSSGDSCDAFSRIVCEGDGDRSGPRFNNPRYDGQALDFCLMNGKGCGDGAAHAFCRMHGYKRAKDQVRRSITNSYETTLRIGDRFVCDERRGHSCDSFSYIKCER